MSDFQRNIILRFFLVFIVITIAFGAVVAKIVHLQTKERDSLLELEQNQSRSNREIPAKRGNIYDCNGRLLAGSIPTYLIFIDTKAESLRKNNGSLFFSNIDSISTGLAAIFADKSAEKYKQYLLDGYKKGKRRLRLNAHRATYTQYKRVMNIPFFKAGRQTSGTFAEIGHQRIKPFGSLCSRTIGGTYADTGYGNSGIEKQYDETLRGKPGEGIRQRVGNFTTDIPIVEAIDGSDVITTIDADLQDIVESELRRTLSQTGGEWACCILMETNGEVKAICNLDRNADGTYTEQINHAVTRMEPGSMFKTISLMAALDDGKVQLTDTFHVSSKGWVYQDRNHPINDSHYIQELKGVMTVKQGLTTSSNIVLAKVVTSSYDKKAEKYVNKLRDMGMCKTFECDVPGAQAPRIDVPKDRETLARMSFGYSVEIPPIYTLMYYNAIANNGRMVTPIMVKEIRSNNETEKRLSPKTLNSSVCSKSTLSDIRECLESVVWDTLGTAAPRRWSNKAKSQKVHIAGKTGTARVFENGAYLNTWHRIAFCGYFPMEEPKYTCICVIHRVNSRDAGSDCGGTVRRIAERAMAHHSIELEQLNEGQIDKPHIKKGLHSQALKVSRKLDLGLKRDKHEWGGYNNELEYSAVEIKQNTLPDVRGMGAKDAIYAIEQTGMIASVRGSGRVVTQSITAGSKPTRGGTVVLELR